MLGRIIDNLIPTNPLSLFQREQTGKLSRMTGPERMDAGWEGVGRYLNDPIAGKTRRVALGIAAGLGAANALDINPAGITDKLTSLATLAVHGGIGVGLMKSKPFPGAGVLGLGYLGLTVFNTFMKGDNPGPM